MGGRASRARREKLRLRRGQRPPSPARERTLGMHPTIVIDIVCQNYLMLLLGVLPVAFDLLNKGAALQIIFFRDWGSVFCLSIHIDDFILDAQLFD